MGKVAMSEYERVEVRSRAQWRAWLEANHTQAQSVWLVTFKKSSGEPSVPYAEIVEEALCFGWVDSLPRKLDERRSMLLLSPRRRGSPWSKLNKQRVARLVRAGLMTPAGQAKIDAAKEDGTWSVYDVAESLEVPEDLARVFRGEATARAHFEAFSASSRKGILWWIASAKRPETRARRIAETVRLARDNVKANHPEARRRGG